MKWFMHIGFGLIFIVGAIYNRFGNPGADVTIDVQERILSGLWHFSDSLLVLILSGVVYMQVYCNETRKLAAVIFLYKSFHIIFDILFTLGIVYADNIVLSGAFLTLTFTLTLIKFANG